MVYRAAAESGWDFSSRWFLPPPGTVIDSAPVDALVAAPGTVHADASVDAPVAAPGTVHPGLEHTRTSLIIPADLNAFLAQVRPQS
jgi:hypothetical protein